MSDILFSVFPNENFVDIGLYQYGWEQCEPSHSLDLLPEIIMSFIM